MRNPFKKITLQEAVNILAKHLNEDDSYFYSWQANIAVQFQDVCKEQNIKSIRKVAIASNEAAKRFLRLLIKEGK